jgi:predicted Zn-dependent protease
MRVNNGTISMEEMKKGPYLHVVQFSDFQMDALSGYFGGEIRLAYLYDGETVTPVTGGSINGNMLELQKNMVFSTERYKNSKYDGPLAVRFFGVPVAGE